MVVITPLISALQIRCDFIPSLKGYRRRKSDATTADETTLEAILADEIGLNLFSRHLMREFSTENIEFWKEIEQYRLTLEAELADLADTLVELYVNEGSPHQVNLPFNVRKQVEGDVKAKNITLATFDKAQHEILLLMKKDSLARFKKGDLFEEYQRSRKKGLAITNYFRSGSVSGVIGGATRKTTATKVPAKFGSLRSARTGSKNNSDNAINEGGIEVVITSNQLFGKGGAEPRPASGVASAGGGGGVLSSTRPTSTLGVVSEIKPPSVVASTTGE